MGIWIPGGLKDEEPTPPMPDIVTWAEGTDEQIVAMLEAHYNDMIDITEYWSVGDERVVSISEITNRTYVGETQPVQNITLVLMNVGGKELVESINGHTECAFIVGSKYILSNRGLVTNSDVTTGWFASGRRTWCNSYFYDAFPSTLKPIFKLHNNYVGATYTSNTPTKSEDYFCLPSVKEVIGSNGGANAGAEANNTLLTYYETSANRIKKNTSNSAFEYWTSSKYYTTLTRQSKYMCSIRSTGTDSSAGGSISLGIAPQGVI